MTPYHLVTANILCDDGSYFSPFIVVFVLVARPTFGRVWLNYRKSEKSNINLRLLESVRSTMSPCWENACTWQSNIDGDMRVEHWMRGKSEIDFCLQIILVRHWIVYFNIYKWTKSHERVSFRRLWMSFKRARKMLQKSLLIT